VEPPPPPPVPSTPAPAPAPVPAGEEDDEETKRRRRYIVLGLLLLLLLLLLLGGILYYLFVVKDDGKTPDPVATTPTAVVTTTTPAPPPTTTTPPVETATVPTVTGMTATQAIEVLKGAGFDDVKVILKSNGSEATADDHGKLVILVNPGTGTVVPKTTQIVLTVDDTPVAPNPTEGNG
jgi:hypothetical protein